MDTMTKVFNTFKGFLIINPVSNEVKEAKKVL